jgi:hypothetical protein
MDSEYVGYKLELRRCTEFVRIWSVDYCKINVQQALPGWRLKFSLKNRLPFQRIVITLSHLVVCVYIYIR